jgi:hypothetical protein
MAIEHSGGLLVVIEWQLSYEPVTVTVEGLGVFRAATVLHADELCLGTMSNTTREWASVPNWMYSH